MGENGGVHWASMVSQESNVLHFCISVPLAAYRAEGVKTIYCRRSPELAHFARGSPFFSICFVDYKPQTSGECAT